MAGDIAKAAGEITSSIAGGGMASGAQSLFSGESSGGNTIANLFK